MGFVARPANKHVKHYPARLTHEGGVHAVTWAVSPQRAYEVTAFMANQRNGQGGYIVGLPTDLTAAQVLRVASSLP